jgi:hypothetical protein
MSESKAQEMVTRLLQNTAGMKYGCVSVSVKLHDGQVAQVLYSTTENIRESEMKAFEKDQSMEA